jgi:hypothetical protein
MSKDREFRFSIQLSKFSAPRAVAVAIRVLQQCSDQPAALKAVAAFFGYRIERQQ